MSREYETNMNFLEFISLFLLISRIDWDKINIAQSNMEQMCIYNKLRCG